MPPARVRSGLSRVGKTYVQPERCHRHHGQQSNLLRVRGAVHRSGCLCWPLEGVQEELLDVHCLVHPGGEPGRCCRGGPGGAAQRAHDHRGGRHRRAGGLRRRQRLPPEEAGGRRAEGGRGTHRRQPGHQQDRERREDDRRLLQLDPCNK